MQYPFEPFKKDGRFGEDRGTYIHGGEDINGLEGGNTDCGTKLRAIYEGKMVHTSESDVGYGNIAVYEIHGPWGVRWVRYAHCQEFERKTGNLKEGDTVALMGSTGNSTACHLHFDIFKKKPTRWRFVAKNREMLNEYFENPTFFIEAWKFYTPPPPEQPYDWLKSLAHENNIKNEEVEGWIRNVLDKSKRYESTHDILVKTTNEMNEYKKQYQACDVSLSESIAENEKLKKLVEEGGEPPMEKVEPKYPWKSSTLWINFIPLVILLIQLVMDNFILDPNVVLVLTSIANVLNRFRAPANIQPIKLK